MVSSDVDHGCHWCGADPGQPCREDCPSWDLPPRIAEALAAFKGDQRMKELFIWGVHTDRVSHPCECCGTPLAVLECANQSTFPATWKRWVEILQDNGPDITDLVFCDHEPTRCRSLRERTHP